MIIFDRWKQIQGLLGENDYITVEEFTKELGVSEATVRRDLNSMEEKGLLERFRGGAQRKQGVFLESNKYQKANTIAQRLYENHEEKVKIAKRAAAFIKEGDYIFVDASSTTYFMIDFIEAKEVTVITNAVMILPKLMEKSIRTYVLNGYLDICSESIMSDDANIHICQMNFNKAFIGTYGISEKSGYTTYDPIEGSYKRNIIERTENVFVLADQSKFDRNAFFSYAPLEACALITDIKNEITEKLSNVIYCDG